MKDRHGGGQAMKRAGGAWAMWRGLSLLVLLVSGMWGLQAVAQTATGGAAFDVEAPAEAPVKVTLSAWLVTTAVDGTETLAPATEARPGDLIEYRIESVNTSGATLKGQALNLPIPAGTTYVADSARPGAVLASTDGATGFAPVPLKREVDKPGGGRETVDVPLSEYRALRWVVGIQQAGQRAQVQARVRVDAP